MKRKRLEDDGNNNSHNDKRSRISQVLDISEPEVKDEFILTSDIVLSSVLHDIANNCWKVGKPIGKGSFGEIFLATDNVSRPVGDDASYVAKIEPHHNGPLFVEIHCLLNVNKQNGELKAGLMMKALIKSLCFRIRRRVRRSTHHRYS